MEAIGWRLEAKIGNNILKPLATCPLSLSLKRGGRERSSNLMPPKETEPRLNTPMYHLLELQGPDESGFPLRSNRRGRLDRQGKN